MTKSELADATFGSAKAIATTPRIPLPMTARRYRMAGGSGDRDELERRRGHLAHAHDLPLADDGLGQPVQSVHDGPAPVAPSDVERVAEVGLERATVLVAVAHRVGQDLRRRHAGRAARGTPQRQLQTPRELAEVHELDREVELPEPLRVPLEIEERPAELQRHERDDVCPTFGHRHVMPAPPDDRLPLSGTFVPL